MPNIKNPWKFDAADHPDPDDYLRLTPVGDDRVLRFCGKDLDAEDWYQWPEQCILQGRRGLGKSFLLQARSARHRALAGKRTLFHPEGGHPRVLVENFVTLSGGVGRNSWLRSTDAIHTWCDIWQVAILGMLAWRICGESLGNLPMFAQAFPAHRSLDAAWHRMAPDTDDDEPERDLRSPPPLLAFVGQLIGSLPHQKDDMEALLKELVFKATREWAQSILSELSTLQLRQIAVYLDNADEMTDVSDGPMWVNIQQGLVLAIGKLRKGKVLRERNLTIFCSIRSEAILARSESQQVSDLLLPLTYTQSDLETMFKTCCRLTEDSRLAFPDLREDDPVRAFLGASTYEHSDRTELSGHKRREDALSAIIRHTRLVPRELIAIGKDIHDKISAQERREGATRAIREKVNAQAATNIDFFLNSCYPPWKDSVSELLPSLNVSVLRRADLLDPSDPKLVARRLNALKSLVAWGLLGCSETSQASKYLLIQRFAFDPESVGAVQELAAKCERFFVHTAFKEWLRSKGWVADWRESPEHLAGNELTFRSGRPIFTLSILDAAAAISVRNGSTDQPVDRSCSNEHVSCLFALLCVWKIREGKGQITDRHLKAIKTALKRNGREVLSFQVADIGKCEDLARKMRKCLKDWNVPTLDIPPVRDRRRSTVLTCDTTDGSLATFALPGIDPGEIEFNFEYAAVKDKLKGLA